MGKSGEFLEEKIGRGNFVHFVIRQITRNMVSLAPCPRQTPFGMRYLHMDIVTHSPMKSNSQAAAFLTPSGFS